MSIRAFLSLLLLLPLGTAWAEDVRVLVSIGNDVGDPGDEPLEHAERDAERVTTLFTSIGQVDPSRSLLVVGQTATVIRERLAEAVGRVKELAARGDSVTFLVFVSGHAKDGAFHLRGTHLLMNELRTVVDTSGASLSVVVVDACESGAIARSKGGRVVPEFTVTVEPQTVKGAVYISSSGPAEASQEHAALQGSLFTHHWLTGLRGDADVDGDGRVSLNEVYTYAFRRTVAGAAQLGQHPTFDIDAAGAGDVVLSRPGKSRSAIVFPSEAEGAFVLVSQPRPDLVAELVKEKGKVVRLAVTPGRYELRKRLGMQVGLITFDLAFGGERIVDERALSMHHFAEVVSKGAHFEQRPFSFLVGFGVETEQLAGLGLRLRPAVGVRATWGTWWAKGMLGLTGSRAQVKALTTTEWQPSLELSAGYRWLQWPVIPWVGVLVDGRWLNQSYVREGEATIRQVFSVEAIAPRNSFGVSAGVAAGLDVPLGETFFVSGEVDGLVRFLQVAEQPSPFTFGAAVKIGGGVRW